MDREAFFSSAPRFYVASGCKGGSLTGYRWSGVAKLMSGRYGLKLNRRSLFLDEPIINLTAQIVSAHLSNNPTAPQQLPAIIRTVHQALAAAGATAVAPQKPEPAVAVKKSVFADHIVCLECGGDFKLLKRHLAAVHQMQPGEYRLKWGLPPSYPVVAPQYTAKRSELAKHIGLGLTKKSFGGKQRSSSKAR
jgi:predicted transcriptional regulator